MAGMLAHPHYVDPPDTEEVFMDLFESPSDVCDQCGTEMEAYFRAPASGSYVFKLAADDGGHLWIGDTEDQALADDPIASVPGWSAARQWDKYSDQTSRPIILAAGQEYFLRATANEGGGMDNLAVGVEGPGGLSLLPIPVEGYLYAELGSAGTLPHPIFLTTCQACEAGRFGATTGNKQCTPCTGGRGSPEGSTECACPAEMLSDASGDCIRCPDGHRYDEVSGDTVPCAVCPVGTRMDNSVATSSAVEDIVAHAAPLRTVNGYGYMGCFVSHSAFGWDADTDMGNPDLPRAVVAQAQDPAVYCMSQSDIQPWCASTYIRPPPLLPSRDLGNGGGLQICADYCTSLGGYKYIGLTWGVLCTCGNEYGALGEQPALSALCGADGLQCGNGFASCGFANAVYKLFTAEYFGVDEELGWEDARNYCRDHYDGDLASIHSQSDNARVVAECTKTRDHANSRADHHYCHIGLNDMAVEGQFEWSDGSAVDFQNWRSGQPDSYGGGEDTVVIFDRGDSGRPIGTWDDGGPDNGLAGTEWGDYAVGFVCQGTSTEEGTCPACEAGRFSTTTGNKQCTSCQQGSRWLRVHDGERPTTCDVCPAGFFAADPDADSCELCPAGSFSQRVCELCPLIASGRRYQWASADSSALHCFGTTCFGGYDLQVTTLDNVAACAAPTSSMGSSVIDLTDGYADNMDCSWIVQCDGGTPVLTFPSLNLEESWDFVTVFDPDTNTLLARVSGILAQYPVEVEYAMDAILSPSSSIKIQFTSDGSVTNDGFVARVECGTLSSQVTASWQAASDCTLCEPGFYDHDQSPTTPCTECPQDTYAAVSGLTQCSSCPVGLFSDPASVSADNCTTRERVYVGCFVDGPVFDTVLAGTMVGIDLPSESRDTCAALCQDYKYMGLTWSNQCRCGDTYGSSGPADSEVCGADGMNCGVG